MTTERPSFQNPDMNGESFSWPAGETGVLLLHGFTATTVEMQPFAKLLHAQGFSVSAPLLPGHGTQVTDLNRVGWQDWVTAAEDCLRDLQAQCSQVWIAGESMGGLLAVYLAARHPKIHGLLLYAPAVRIRKIWIAPFLAPFVSIRPKTYVDTAFEEREPEKFPWQGYTAIPMRGLAQLAQLQRTVWKVAPKVQVPVLIFQGGRDQTVDATGARLLLDRLGSSEKELVWLERSRHVVLLDWDFDTVAERSLDFIRAHP
jgi:carboxylesterase